MRGVKQDIWEGGIKVPAFANWPGKIDAKQINQPLHIIDWLPTLAGLTGIDLSVSFPPEDVSKFEGMDISPLLVKGDVNQSDRQTRASQLENRELYWSWGKKPSRWALRVGDWKIAHDGKPNTPPLNPEDWELYDLSQDPKEATDLASQMRGEFPSAFAAVSKN